MSANEKPAFAVRLRSKRVQREIDKLKGSEYQRVIDKLKVLEKEARPPGCEKIHGDNYRVRSGEIRIIYLVDEENRRIEVGAIRRRSKRTYKDVESLF